VLRPGLLYRLQTSGCDINTDMFERRVLVKDIE
jgi:hypothetical protein